MSRLFYKNSSKAPARPWLKTALSIARKRWGGKAKQGTRYALDIGSGSGVDTIALIRSGFQVVALDRSRLSFEFLRRNLKGRRPSTLTLVNCSIQRFCRTRKNCFDLVNASFVLPFLGPRQFARQFNKILALLKPGGILSFNLFGRNDSWNQPGQHRMAFQSKPEIKRLLKRVKVVSLKCWEYDGFPACGPKKHWHIYGIVACREISPKSKSQRRTQC